MNYFMSDLEEINDYLSWGTVSLVDAFFLSTYTIIKMFNLSWSLSLIAGIPIVLIMKSIFSGWFFVGASVILCGISYLVIEFFLKNSSVSLLLSAIVNKCKLW